MECPLSENKCASAYEKSKVPLARNAWSASGFAPECDYFEEVDAEGGSAGAERQQHFVTNV